MSTGFGNEPSGRGPKGLRADQPPPSPNDDIHAIRLRFCGPGTLSPQNISLATNAAQRFDFTGTPINAFILTTATGQINMYFGDFTSGSGKPAVIPHVVGSAAIVPSTEIIPVPPRTDYIITVQEGAAAAAGATGTIIPIYQ